MTGVYVVPGRKRRILLGKRPPVCSPEANEVPLSLGNAPSCQAVDRPNGNFVSLSEPRPSFKKQADGKTRHQPESSYLAIRHPI